MARSKERYRRLIRGYNCMDMPSTDVAFMITLSAVGFPIVAIYSAAWWMLPLTVVFIVMAYDAHRSQREVSELHRALLNDDTFNALSLDNMRWLHTRARRRFVGVMALALAAGLMLLLPAIV